MKNKYLIDQQIDKSGEDVGEKARNIRWLIQHGQKVPRSFVIPYEVQELYFKDEHDILADLGAELKSTLALEKYYAVRSSANLEDGAVRSFAGQFNSYLNVHGLDDLLISVQEIWKSEQLPRVQAYLDNTQLAAGSLQMGVLIQEMVAPVVSGVAFSRNPLTGLDEIIVEAVEGSGEALLQEGITPYRWVSKWGSWIIQPDESPIAINIIQEVVDESSKLAELYGVPVDLEWVYDGQELYWVQLRPISGLNEVDIYSNRIAKEVFPGQIKPLIWSINVPLVNGAWIRLLTELIGPNDLTPDQLAKQFANRAYFNMGALGQIFTTLGFPKDSLELLLGLEGGDKRPTFRPSMKIVRFLPRMARFMVNKLQLGKTILPAVEDFSHELASLDIEHLTARSDDKLLEEQQELFEIVQQQAYLNIVVPLLMNGYNTAFTRQLEAIDIESDQINLREDLPELAQYDPNSELDQLAVDFLALGPETQQAVRDGGYKELAALPDNEYFKRKFNQFIDKYGHFSDSGNDFSSLPWRENPDLVLSLILSKTSTASRQPEEEGTGQDRQEKVRWQDLNLTYSQRVRLTPFYNRARKFLLYREAISSSYTYGYGLFREYYEELARRLIAEGLLEAKDDVYYLTSAEIRELFQSTQPPQTSSSELQPADLIAQRRAEMAETEDRILPEIIYGNQTPPIIEAGESQHALKGVPSARGYYRGKTKVIRSIEEFENMNAGEVLVIPYSDVSWTPLFSRAGAVISESGGILSHSSIIAREYNIPCIVSVPGALQIPDQTLVTVDGYTGELFLHTDENNL